MSQARARTKGQRGAKSDADTTGPILDEQEQDAEIKQLRQADEASNARAGIILDVALAVVTLISFMNLYQSLHRGDRTITRLYTLQTIFLPLSLSPQWLPLAWSNVAPRLHPIVAGVQVALTNIQILIAGPEAWNMADLSKLAMPAFISCAIELQRRGERNAAESLIQLEKARYKLKGA